MSGLSFVLVTLELILVVAIVWALLNESFFVEIENRMIEHIALRIRAHRKHKNRKAKQPHLEPVDVVTASETIQYSPFVA